jgi:hypothetical protein
MQVSSVGRGNFSFSFFLISYLIFYLIQVGLKVLPQISTIQDANEVWYVVYGMCKSSFPFFKTKNYFLANLSRKKNRQLSLAYLSWN